MQGQLGGRGSAWGGDEAWSFAWESLEEPPVPWGVLVC